MSILIKGIDMPKNCGSCDNLRDDLESSYCYLMDKDISDGTIRAEFCPLVEIPTPHGRLIDGVELIKTITENAYIIKHGYNEAEYGMSCFGIMQAIYDAPTILEAEE